MIPKAPRLRMKLWIDIEGDNAFGMGSVVLLRGVLNTGSLAGAAKELDMSYRTAWGRIRKIEERLGRPVLIKRGGNKSGYQLSPFGAQCLEAYEAMYAATMDVAQQEFASRFDALFHSK